MKRLLLLILIPIFSNLYSQTNSCSGVYTFGAGNCQKIIIGDGTPGQIQVCLTTNNISPATGGNKCNPGGSCNPPFSGGGWNPGIYIFNSNSTGTDYVGTLQQDWQDNAPIGCYTLTLSTGYAVLFGLCNINNTQISWTTVGGCNPLPVTLTSFTVENFPKSYCNMIRWTTASEQNSSHFYIERSTTGEFTENSVIDHMTAMGNSSTAIHYTILDQEYLPTINYYRLVQVDLDGKFVEYGPIMIDNRQATRVVKLINTAGQQVNQDATGILFEVHDDGTVKKIFK